MFQVESLHILIKREFPSLYCNESISIPQNVYHFSSDLMQTLGRLVIAITFMFLPSYVNCLLFVALHFYTVFIEPFMHLIQLLLFNN